MFNHLTAPKYLYILVVIEIIALSAYLDYYYQSVYVLVLSLFVLVFMMLFIYKIYSFTMTVLYLLGGGLFGYSLLEHSALSEFMFIIFGVIAAFFRSKLYYMIRKRLRRDDTEDYSYMPEKQNGFGVVIEKYDSNKHGNPYESMISYKQKEQNYSNQKQQHTAKQAGQEGEKETAYQLRFIRDKYSIFHGVHLSGGGERQEFDHIVIGPNGVFHIETKNYVGNIKFTQNGMERDQGPSYSDDPLAQVYRHDYVIREFLKENDLVADVVGVLCFTSPNSRVEGQDPLMKIVKVGMLNSTILSYVPQKILTPLEIEKIEKAFLSRITKSQTYKNV